MDKTSLGFALGNPLYTGVARFICNKDHKNRGNLKLSGFPLSYFIRNCVPLIQKMIILLCNFFEKL